MSCSPTRPDAPRTGPAYVAWALARVKAREGLSDEVLAARLGIATVDLPRLALCLRPRLDHWDEDLAQIASRFGLAPEPLNQSA
jgi:hypothetical protein